jgi:hypothetical protein
VDERIGVDQLDRAGGAQRGGPDPLHRVGGARTRSGRSRLPPSRTA